MSDFLNHRLWLPPHVYACELPQGIVLLDLQRNRYFGIDAASSRTFSTLLSDGAGELSSAARAWIAQGLLQSTLPASRPFTPAHIDLRAPLMSLEDLGTSATQLWPQHLARFFWHAAATGAVLRCRSLYDIAQQILALRRHTDGTAREFRRLSIAVSHFRRLRPWAFEAHDRCLFHALALTRFLLAQRLSASWVIGVRLRPWGAHSWVQSGTILLDTTPEVVREFTPIIAV